MLRPSTSKPSWRQMTLPYAPPKNSSHCPAALPTHTDQHTHRWTDFIEVTTQRRVLLRCYIHTRTTHWSASQHIRKWLWCMAITNTRRRHRWQDPHHQPHKYCTYPQTKRTFLSNSTGVCIPCISNLTCRLQQRTRRYAISRWDIFVSLHFARRPELRRLQWKRWSLRGRRQHVACRTSTTKSKRVSAVSA